MGAHAEIDKVLSKHRLTVDTSTAGVSKVLAANATLSAQQLHEVIRGAEAEGYEVHLAAGDLRIRPKDSVL